ncbi:valyl-tRNA synthetase [Nematocida minor]|uniref:valyl-tRNA synthetase n=1 Tax=Nematocida minor TaxID=1912983 RepID=UPI0022211667|nr:valyl-tRNA synthetase [Nematocida minor]KAI5190030.1 valyl-tRNA synthetase [Nematocida minor]
MNIEELRKALHEEKDERKKAKIEKKIEKMVKFLNKLQVQKDTAPKEGKPKTKKVIEFEEAEEIPAGEKKAVKDLAGQFNPKSVENGWFSWWEKEGYFTPEFKTKVQNGKTFTIVLPPPNVTGSLHVGHAMMASIQDTVVRLKRMLGYKTLYLPGTDHAGIATQVVVEKAMEKQGKHRKDCTREEFLEKVWEWKEQHGTQIVNQFRRLGTSLDFTREKFTMDEELSQAVTEAFVRFHEDGLIYRGNRLVNWCAKIQTTLSDLEVDHKTVEPYEKVHTDGKEHTFGVIYTVKYEIEANGKTYTVEVPTTRPETIFGDSALCAHPNDERYSHFKNSGNNESECTPINPLTGEKMRFVFDEAAEMDFGTGLLKITPAHDPTDFEVGLRHNLLSTSVIDANNRMTVGPFKNMLRFDARRETVALLKSKGLLVREEGHPSSIPICSRTGEVIEPRLTAQWWMNCKELAKKAQEVTKTGTLKVLPNEMCKVWDAWLSNVRDWCLSRQLWWGHRIPAYSRNGVWYVARSKEEAEKQAGGEVEQEEDVLDTWFSSGLWPFAVLGWPKDSDDMLKYYPTSLLETGKDIVFFWVARMVMMGIALTGKCPFDTVLFHSIVRDAHGEKMSKSKGNVIDPVDVISGVSLDDLLKKLKNGNLSEKEIKTASKNIAQEYPQGIEACGSDALRYSLLSSASLGRDVCLSIEKVVGCRKFCNKVWNAMKFALSQNAKKSTNNSNASETDENMEYKKSSFEYASDRWIESRFLNTVRSTAESIETYNFMKAAVDVQQFMIYEFCDFYLEMFKGRKDSAGIRTLRMVALGFVKMAHPLLPFLTEEIYQVMKNSWELDGYTWMPSITVEEYPLENNGIEKESAEEAQWMDSVLELVKSARSKVSLKTGITKIVVESSEKTQSLERASGILARLMGVEVSFEKDAAFDEEASGIQYKLV